MLTVEQMLQPQLKEAASKSSGRPQPVEVCHALMPIHTFGVNQGFHLS
jgi:hypothetical protein